MLAVRREKRCSRPFCPWHSDGMELAAGSYQELRSATADVRQSRSIRRDGNASRPGRTWSHRLGRVDRQHGPHYLLRRCGAQPTPDRGSRKRIGVIESAQPHYGLRMVACFSRKVGKDFESLLILESQPRSVCVYPRLELVAVCKMKSVQERPLIVADRHGPLTGANRLLELPYVNLNQVRIEPELSSRREYDVAAKRVSDRVDRLIERVLCPRAGAFRPEVGLDPFARETLPTAQAEDRQQTQRPLLLRGYGDRASLVAQGQRSQKLEDQHFPATRAL